MTFYTLELLTLDTLAHREHGEGMASNCHQGFYYGERRGKLCLTLLDKLIIMSPGQGMRACFSLSAPSMLFYMQNMGRDWVPIAIKNFIMGGGGENCV